MHFDMICTANPWYLPLLQETMLRGIRHRLTKPRRPWTNRQVERMNRTIRHTLVRLFHDDSHDPAHQMPGLNTQEPSNVQRSIH
jgi:hypothetical protein